MPILDVGFQAEISRLDDLGYQTSWCNLAWAVVVAVDCSDARGPSGSICPECGDARASAIELQ